MIVWQNTLCTVGHPAMGLLTALVVLSSAARWCNTTQFFLNGVILHACVHGRRKDFSMEGKSGEICFFHSKLGKQPFC